MANEKDKQTGRFIEALIYDTPAYRLSRTSDGRIVSELSKGRREADAQHRDLMTTQAGVVAGLQKVQAEVRERGREYSPGQQALLQAAERIKSGQDDLIYETRVLQKVTALGVNELGNRIDNVGDAVEGVRAGVDRVDANISGLRSDIAHHAREAQGPRAPQSSLASLIRGRNELIQVLSAYQGGQLSAQGRRAFEDLIQARFVSPGASAHLRQVLRVVSDRVREEGLRRSRIADFPQELVDPGSRDQAIHSVGFIEQIAKQYPNQDLTDFILSLYALLNMCEEAQRTPTNREFLVALVNNKFAAEGVSFEVKRTNRDARMTGSAVDRNFNLIEGLEQGDRMIAQEKLAQKSREKILAQLGMLVSLQQNSLANLARQRLLQAVDFFKKAETKEDFEYVLVIFQKALEEDPTLMAAQYGAGISAESAGNLEEALKRYRIVSRMSDQREVAAEALERFARIQANLGDPTLLDKLEEERRAREAREAAIQWEKDAPARASRELARKNEARRAEQQAMAEFFNKDTRLAALRIGYNKMPGQKPYGTVIGLGLQKVNPINGLPFVDCLENIETDEEGGFAVWVYEGKLIISDSGAYAPEETFHLDKDFVSEKILKPKGKIGLLKELYIQMQNLSAKKYDVYTAQTFGPILLEGSTVAWWDEQNKKLQVFKQPLDAAERATPGGKAYLRQREVYGEATNGVRGFLAIPIDALFFDSRNINTFESAVTSPLLTGLTNLTSPYTRWVRLR